jgi:hypothetical protein
MRKYSRKELESFDTDTLQEITYNMGMKNSKKYSRDKSIKKILRYNLSSEDEDKIKSLGITKLKEKAKQLGLSGYTSYKSENKDELSKKIIKKIMEDEEKETQLAKDKKDISSEVEKVEKKDKSEKVEKSEKKDKYSKETLSKLTIPLLKEIADDNSIYIKSGTKKADIIELINKSLGKVENLSPKKVSPKKVSPKKVSPKKVSPKKSKKEVSPKKSKKEVSPKKGSPKKVSPKKVSPKKSKKEVSIEETEKELKATGITALKNIARDMGISGFSKYKSDTKNELISIIIKQKKKDVEKKIEKLPSPKKDSPKKDSPKKDSPKKDSPKKVSPKKDLPKKASPKKDSPKEVIITEEGIDIDKIAKYKEKLMASGINEKYLEGLNEKQLKKLYKQKSCNEDNDYECDEGNMCDVNVNKCRKDKDIPDKYTLSNYKKNPIAGSSKKIKKIMDKLAKEDILLRELSDDQVVDIIKAYIKSRKIGDSGNIDDIDIQLLANQRNLDLDSLKQDVDDELKVGKEDFVLSEEDESLLEQIEEEFKQQNEEDELEKEYEGYEEGEEGRLGIEDVEDVLEEIQEEEILQEETLKQVQNKILKCLGLLG